MFDTQRKNILTEILEKVIQRMPVGRLTTDRKR